MSDGVYYYSRLLLAPLFVLSSACDHRDSGDDWTNESRVHEDALKSEVEVQFADAPAHLFRMAVETSYPLGEGGPRRPSAAAPVGTTRALVVENNSGRVFINSGRELHELELSDKLVFPGPLRAGDARFYVADSEGLKSFAYSGQRHLLLQSFLSIRDFAFVTQDGIVVNPVMRRADAPILALVRSPAGTVVRTWGRERAMLVPGPKTAHLASCGGRIVVGLAYEPMVFVLGASLESEEVVIELPFPKKAELLALATDQRMVRPAPGVVSAPTFVAGVACVDESSFFVLLDLPWLCILEYEFSSRLVAIHHVDNSRPGRHYRRLNASKELDGIRFLTLAEDGTGPRAIVEAVAKDL